MKWYRGKSTNRSYKYTYGLFILGKNAMLTQYLFERNFLKINEVYIFQSWFHDYLPWFDTSLVATSLWDWERCNHCRLELGVCIISFWDPMEIIYQKWIYRYDEYQIVSYQMWQKLIGVKVAGFEYELKKIHH